MDMLYACQQVVKSCVYKHFDLYIYIYIRFDVYVLLV